MSTRSLFHDELSKTTGVGVSDWVIAEQVLTRWWRLVAFMNATNLLHRAMCMVLPPHCDGHRNGQQRGYMLHHRCVDYRPGSRLGNMEQVVAQWRHPVASGEAPVMLHWAMRSVSHRCTAMAIEMARNGGAFVRCRRLFRLL